MDTDNRMHVGFEQNGGMAKELLIAQGRAFRADSDDPDVFGHMHAAFPIYPIFSDSSPIVKSNPKTIQFLVYTLYSMSNTPSSNPFAILNLPTRFDLDAGAIERAYLSGLTSAHPDAGGEQIDAASDAASLNHARKTLLDGESRAIALLDILGGPAAGDCKELPDGFLMEMMTRREEIEEQIADGSNETRANWESWAQDERNQYSSDAQLLFDRAGDDPEPDILTEIRILLNAWRYIERLIEQLDPEYDPANADFR